MGVCVGATRGWIGLVTCTGRSEAFWLESMESRCRISSVSLHRTGSVEDQEKLSGALEREKGSSTVMKGASDPPRAKHILRHREFSFGIFCPQSGASADVIASVIVARQYLRCANQVLSIAHQLHQEELCCECRSDCLASGAGGPDCHNFAA